MVKTNGWVNALSTLVFIVSPAIIGFFFWLPDWTNLIILPYYVMWLIVIGFLIYSLLISLFLIFFQITSWAIINFNLPLAFVFGVLFISYPLPLWLRAILVFVMIFSAFPINNLTLNLEAKWKKIQKFNNKI